MNLQEYEKQLSTIDEKLLSRRFQIPVAIMLQEAEDLYVWSQDDKEVLTRCGLDWALVDSLPERSAMCRHIQSEWQKKYKSRKIAQKEWALKSPPAFALRKELLHHFSHAYRDISHLQNTVNRISKNSRNDELIQDLSDLAALGLKNKTPLEKIGMNMELLQQASDTCESMAKLLAKVHEERIVSNKLKISRDKTYTYLKQALDEIRRTGQYAFYKNEDRKKGYVSAFLRKKNKNKQLNTNNKIDQIDNL